jgi:hypothetical protein
MKPNQNLDPLAALNNVTEEELSAIQEEEAAKPRKRKPRDGFVFLILRSYQSYAGTSSA